MIRKLCGDCFAKEFPGAKTGTLTWGHQCHSCHKPTAGLATLIKVGSDDA